MTVERACKNRVAQPSTIFQVGREMPPKLPRLRKALVTKSFIVSICPSCRHQTAFSVSARSLQPQWRLQHQRALHPRKASTLAPVTVVNAVKDIPPAARELHEALEALQREALVYTSLSQLQLALRGLESKNAVTRVALLSLDGFRGARRLARVLLADPVSSEMPWEKRLVDAEDNDERALILRHGDKVNYDQRHPLVRTLTIPATTLLTHNLEILIQAVPPNVDTNTRALHTYLVPGLEMASSSATRYSIIRYPVHKALVYSEALQSLPTYATIVSAKSEEQNMIKGTINTPWSNLQVASNSSAIVPVSIERAEVAIQTFRKSLGNSIEYERAWFDSGLPTLSTWLLEGIDPAPQTVKLTIRRLITSLLSATESRIKTEETERLEQFYSTAIPSATRSSLSKLLSAWSENAHTELRDQLSLAFDSPSWRKLAWWKLPWRVDDVAMITADILHRSWLTSAEKELIWLAGRVEQAGLYVPQPSITPAAESAEEDHDEPIQVRRASIFSASVSPPSIESISPVFALSESELSSGMTPKPYPQTLMQARQALSLTTIPSLQAIAQRLLLHSLATTFLTSSLSVLMYISISTTSIYESGTIAALGLVYSMRRLQKRWEEVRASWKEGIRDQGRTALRAVENSWGNVIREGGKQGIDETNLEERKRAKEAVARVRSILDAMDDKKS